MVSIFIITLASGSGVERCCSAGIRLGDLHTVHCIWSYVCVRVICMQYTVFDPTCVSVWFAYSTLYLILRVCPCDLHTVHCTWSYLCVRVFDVGLPIYWVAVPRIDSLRTPYVHVLLLRNASGVHVSTHTYYGLCLEERTSFPAPVLCVVCILDGVFLFCSVLFCSVSCLVYLALD